MRCKELILPGTLGVEPERHNLVNYSSGSSLISFGPKRTVLVFDLKL